MQFAASTPFTGVWQAAQLFSRNACEAESLPGFACRFQNAVDLIRDVYGRNSSSATTPVTATIAIHLSRVLMKFCVTTYSIKPSQTKIDSCPDMEHKQKVEDNRSCDMQLQPNREPSL